MTSAQSSRTVVIAGMLEAFFVLAQARQGNSTHPNTVKSLWAIGVLTLGLSALSDFVPQVAGPFALLVLVALAARSRGDLGRVLGVSGAGGTNASAASTQGAAGASTAHPSRPGGESPGGPQR